MAFLRRRDGGGEEGEGQQPAEQSAPPTPSEQTAEYGYGGDEPTTEQPPAEPSDRPDEPSDQPTQEVPSDRVQEPQAPAVTSEREADPMSASERAAAEDQSHRDARPQTAEDIPDNIWEQTRSGE